MTTPRHQVATAIVACCPRAGRRSEFDDAEQRIANLLRKGPYGAYIEDGDPHGWGGKGTLATIYMEQHGGKDDCELPLDYYVDGLDVAAKASEQLDGCYIEFVNAAVAVVVEG